MRRRVNNLAKHGSVFGMSGYGKTLVGHNIIGQLSARDIPFIVFEPAKAAATGRGVLSHRRYFGPHRIRTPHIEPEWYLPEPPLESAILPYIQNDDWYREAATARMSAELGRLKHAMDRFDDKRARLRWIGVFANAARRTLGCQRKAKEP